MTSDPATMERLAKMADWFEKRGWEQHAKDNEEGVHFQVACPGCGKTIRPGVACMPCLRAAASAIRRVGELEAESDRRLCCIENLMRVEHAAMIGNAAFECACVCHSDARAILKEAKATKEGTQT